MLKKILFFQKLSGSILLGSCLILGCASSSTHNGLYTAQARNPANRVMGSRHGIGNSGKQQNGHYDHQHDQEGGDGIALGSCQVCLSDVTENEILAHKAYACSENHCIDTHCLSHQVKSLEIHTQDQARDLREHGIACCGDGAKCRERIALATIEDLLNPEDRTLLQGRLTKVEESARSGLDSRAEREIIALSHGVEAAFNLCCPANGCGGVLDKIEGCNAATCSDESCKATFCYLCLKPQEDSKSAHAHARDHSDDFWERRPGFTERYHWQISRKELEVTFKGRIDPKVRSGALEPHKTLLEEKNMWPMPAGVKTKAWIKMIEEIPQSSRKYYVYENGGKDRVEKIEQLHTRERKIELLQNEYIFLTREGNKKNAELIKLALQNMGGEVFTSLDARDGARPVVHPVARNDQVEAILGEDQAQVGEELGRNEQLEPVLGEDQVHVLMPLGEEQYRVGTKRDFKTYVNFS